MENWNKAIVFSSDSLEKAINVLNDSNLRIALVVDDEKRFVTGQNQNSGHETAYAMMEILNSQ